MYRRRWCWRWFHHTVGMISISSNIVMGCIVFGRHNKWMFTLARSSAWIPPRLLEWMSVFVPWRSTTARSCAIKPSTSLWCTWPSRMSIKKLFLVLQGFLLDQSPTVLLSTCVVLVMFSQRATFVWIPLSFVKSSVLNYEYLSQWKVVISLQLFWSLTFDLKPKLVYFSRI